MIALLIIAAVQAQEEVTYVEPAMPPINAQMYRQPLDSLTTMWTNDASFRPTKYFTARAGLGYMRDPFVFQYEDDTVVRLLRDAVQLNLQGTINVWRFRLGVDVPIYLLATSDLQERGAAGLGPILVDLKGVILDHDKTGVGLALAARVDMPSNTTNLPLGDGVAYEAELILDGKVGGFVVAANIGHRGVPKHPLEDRDWDDQLMLRGGIGYMFKDQGGLSFDVASSSVYSDIFGKYSTPVEGMLGGWARVNRNLVVRMGLGTGLTQAVGSPAVRAIVSFGWEPTLLVEEPPPPPPPPIEPPPPPPPVIPGPGKLVIRTVDMDDKPVDARATINWVSVPDLVDMPDGSLMMSVAGGSGSEVLTPGALQIRVEADGYLPVDLEGTVVSGQITSFTVPMTTKAAKQGNERIEIKEQVFFDLDKATIKPESFMLLKEVAFLMRQYPEIEMVRIEGHTDSRGSDEYNFRLSNDRAESVLEFLVAKGVERNRLNSIGYGERRPLDPSENEDAWALNRRVDFFIETWNPAARVEERELMEPIPMEPPPEEPTGEPPP